MKNRSGGRFRLAKNIYKGRIFNDPVEAERARDVALKQIEASSARLRWELGFVGGIGALLVVTSEHRIRSLLIVLGFLAVVIGGHALTRHLGNRAKATAIRNGWAGGSDG